MLHVVHQYPCPRHPTLFRVNRWGLFIHWRIENLYSVLLKVPSLDRYVIDFLDYVFILFICDLHLLCCIIMIIHYALHTIYFCLRWNMSTWSWKWTPCILVWANSASCSCRFVEGTMTIGSVRSPFLGRVHHPTHPHIFLSNFRFCFIRAAANIFGAFIL